MITKIKTGLTAIALVFAINCANAQEPQIPQALSSLMKLEGKWEGLAKLTLEGKTYEFTYYVEFRKTADGSGMYMEEWFSSAELGTLKGSNLIGYNANDGKIHWFSVDNYGTTHDHLGTWKSADHFYMEANEMQQKKKFVEKIDMILKGDDAMELTLSATLDGKEFQKFIVNFNRIKM